MNIVIDARPLTSRPTGVAQYLMAAVNVWSELSDENTFILLANKPLHLEASKILRCAKNIQFYYCKPPVLLKNGLVWFIFYFPYLIKKFKADCIWGPCGLLPPFCPPSLFKLLTVNDLVFRSMPKTMSVKTLTEYSMLAPMSIKNADLIWAVSNFTATEINYYYPNRKSHKIIVGCGLNPLRYQHIPSVIELSEIRDKYFINDKTLLFIGTLEPRKNLKFLLSLMPELSVSGWRLLIVGCKGWGKSDLSSIVNSQNYPKDSVTFCDFVSDYTLQGLYRTVSFFISTSLMEGFGLPQLEAMTAGCPVIAAANSAVIEVVGNGGVLVQGWDREIWCSSIKNALNNRGELVSAASQQAICHSIEGACKEVYEIINSKTVEV